MIEFIDNQTIAFNLGGETDSCGCKGQPYCQPVRISDETQFQIKGDIANADPAFGNSYIGWETWTALEINIEESNITGVGLCDGTATITASLGSGSGYQYSFNGGAYSGTNVFTGLCEGSYLIIAKDSDDHYATGFVQIGGYYNCADLAGKELSEMTDIYLNELNNCYLNDAL